MIQRFNGLSKYKHSPRCAKCFFIPINPRRVGEVEPISQKWKEVFQVAHIRLQK